MGYRPNGGSTRRCHPSTRVTEDVYTHVNTRLSAQAATVLNQAL